MSLIAATLRSTTPRLALKGVRWQHPDGHNPVPFTFRNRAAFRAKYLSFLGLGFSLPFVATFWQLRKYNGAA